MRTAYDGEGSAGGLRDGPEEGPYPPPEERPSDAPEGPPEDRSSDPSLRHLLARAILVEERVRRAVAARQATDPQPDDAFRGLYLSDETVHHLLDHGRSLTGPDHADAVSLAEAEVYADAADRDGGPTRLRHLARTFALTELDTDFDYPLQINPAAVHVRGYPMTRDRDIPMKRICDFGANIQHGAPSLLIECHIDGSSGRNFYQDIPERCDGLTQWANRPRGDVGSWTASSLAAFATACFRVLPISKGSPPGPSVAAVFDSCYVATHDSIDDCSHRARA